MQSFSSPSTIFLSPHFTGCDLLLAEPSSPHPLVSPAAGGFMSSPPTAPDAFWPTTTAPPQHHLPAPPTHRTKSHVASACVNCKKKHLGCDSARPCRRCVLTGAAVSLFLCVFLSLPLLIPVTIQSTCVDVSHKKRGRPPLRFEDSVLHSVGDPPRKLPWPKRDTTTTTTTTTTATATIAAAATTHQASRDIRPTTDLQAPLPPPLPLRSEQQQQQQQQQHLWVSSSAPFSSSLPQPPPPLGEQQASPVESSLSRFSSIGFSPHTPSTSTLPTLGSTSFDSASSPRHHYPPPPPLPHQRPPSLPIASSAQTRPVSRSSLERPFTAGSIPTVPIGRSRASAPTDWQSSDRLSWAVAAESAAVERDRVASYPEVPVRLPPILPGPRLSDPYPAASVKWTWTASSSSGGTHTSQTEKEEMSTTDSKEVDRKESMQLSPRSLARQLPRSQAEPKASAQPPLPSQDRGDDDADNEERPAKRPKMSVNEIVNE